MGGLQSVCELRNVPVEFTDSSYKKKKKESIPSKQLLSRTNLFKCLEYLEEFSNYLIMLSFCE